MLWHITKHEIYDHVTSLRFALTTGLTVLLMVLSALIFADSNYKQQFREYAQNVSSVATEIQASCGHLNDLATQGPIAVYKRPSPLAFCANAQEDALPGQIRAESKGGLSITSYSYRYSYQNPWVLQYVQDNSQQDSMLPISVALDWSVIIGVVMSFVALLFTFDVISGERERGTLALVLSNQVSRSLILLSKFLGALISIAIPMLIGMSLSLLTVMLSNTVSFSNDDWARIGLMVVLSLFYISLFVGLGLAMSSRIEHSATNLLALLLVWVIWVILTPNTLGSVASTLHPVPTFREHQQQKDAAIREISKRFDDRFRYGSPTQSNPDIRAIKSWANYMTARLETETHLEDAYLEAQFAQVQFAGQILRISPTAIYNYAMESLAETGFERHRRFVEAARRYRSQFIEFIKAADRADTDSFHVYYLKEGLSRKPVSFESVPRFVEPTKVGIALRSCMVDVSLLVLLLMLFFLMSYGAFLRCKVW